MPLWKNIPYQEPVGLLSLPTNLTHMGTWLSMGTAPRLPFQPGGPVAMGYPVTQGSSSSPEVEFWVR